MASQATGNDAGAVDNAYEQIIAHSNEMYDRGEYKEALDKYEDASRLDPKQGLAWYMKGMTLFKMEKYEEALQAFDMATKLDINLVEPIIGKAYVFMKLFNFNDAIKVLNEAFLKSMDYHIACMIGLCYVMLENEDEAVAWFKRAFEKDKESTLSFFDEMYAELVLKDENITVDEKVAVKAAIDKLKKKFTS
ncbi:MAG: tetratricopeptide repeat protein [Candidatus Micrarchaeota archaeon]|nr:tetratricopeptide repeat protein [Candidatus Micrarchaeota archaeon]